MKEIGGGGPRTFGRGIRSHRGMMAILRIAAADLWRLMSSDLLEGEKAGVAGRLSVRSNLCAKDLHVIQKSGSNRNQERRLPLADIKQAKKQQLLP